MCPKRLLLLSENLRILEIFNTILHEALDVTRGERFVLVSFLYRDEDNRHGTPQK